MSSTPISRSLAIAAFCGAALLAGCAALSQPDAGPPRNDELFAHVDSGMTMAQVQRLLGPPDETTKFPRSNTLAWDYDYQDPWGYHATFSVTFGADGRALSTFTGRIHGGGDFSN